MKNLTLDNIAKVVGGELFFPENYIYDNRTIKGAVIDNRLVEEDYLFIPFKGAKVDGHSFIDAAFDSKALCVLTEQDIEITKGPYIRVESTEQALKDLASFYRMQLDIPIIGIIGSVGKTSTKEMVASVLSVKYDVLKTKGNLNNEIGLPLTLLSIKENHQIAVVEMGISEFGEMDRLGTVAKPDAVVFTNIGQCHLDVLKDRDGILKAKTEVFKHLTKNAVVVVNNDDDKLATIKEDNFSPDMNISVIRYSIESEDGDYRASQVVNHGLEGVSAHVSSDTLDCQIDIGLPGLHNVYNALAACVIGEKYSLTQEEIVRGINEATTIAGRSNFIKTNRLTIIDDCYNANPVSMKASLGVLGQAEGRKVAILGDMGELGVDAQKLHNSVASSVINNKIDLLITVGPMTKEMASQVSSATDSITIHSYETIEECTKSLDNILNPQDTVLVKASHFMAFDSIVEFLKNL